MPQSLSNTISRADEVTKASLFAHKITTPNGPGQEAFFKSKNHYLWVLGGNHSGKTYGGIMRAAMHTLPEKDKYGKPTGFTINPYQRIRVPAGGVLGWISTFSSHVQKTAVQILVDEIFGPYINPNSIKTDDGAYQEFAVESGKVLFRWQQQGVQSYTYGKCDWIMLDEPHDIQIYNECKSRVAMRSGYLWLAMTGVVDPNDPEAWKKLRYLKWMNDFYMIWAQMTDEQREIAFPDFEIFFLPVRENRFLTEQNLKSIEDAYATMGDTERQTRLTGALVVYLGQSLITKDTLERLSGYIVRNPEKTVPEYGQLEFDTREKNEQFKIMFTPTHEEFADTPTAEWIIKIWQHPVRGILGVSPGYVIGVDAAGGGKGGDYTSAYVLRTDTGEIVAALHGHIDERELSKQLFLLGYYYADAVRNPALLSIEVTHYGKTTQALLMEGIKDFDMATYPREWLYRMPNADMLSKGVYIPSFSSSYGWYTSGGTMGTRAYLITTLREYFKKASDSLPNICLIPDKGLIDEARVFISKEKGKYEAAPTYSDDRIMSYAIALMAMKQVTFINEPILVTQTTYNPNKSFFTVEDGEIIMHPEVLKERRQHNAHANYTSARNRVVRL